MGTQSHKSGKHINPMLHYVFKTSHPASVVYKGIDQWSDEGALLKIDRIMQENYNTRIMWYKKKGDDNIPECMSTSAPWLSEGEDSMGLPFDKKQQHG